MARMRAEDRRRQLLEVAAGLFGRYGYRGTTTAQLATAAGITEPILYRHFENKLDLFVTLIDEVGKEVLNAWRKAMESVTEPKKRLEALLAANPATHTRGKTAYRVIFRAMTEAEGDAAIHAALRTHIAKLHSFLKSEVADLQSRNVVRKDEPAAALAWMLIDIAIGHGMVSPIGAAGYPKTTAKTNMQKLVAELLTRR